MSFFSSLQQYVTSGVANLGLGSRRFSLPRQGSNEIGPVTEGKTPGIAATVGNNVGGGTSGSIPPSQQHGELIFY